MVGRLTSLALLGVTIFVHGCATPDVATTDSEALAVAWLEFVSDLQAEALSDRVVTRDEYRDSVTATAACMEQFGYTVGPILEADRGLRLYFQVNPGTNRDDPSKSYDQCAFDNHFAVESVYFQQLRLPSADQAEAELVACLQNQGVAGIGRYSDDFDLVEVLEESNATPEAWACRGWFQIVSGEIGVWPPGWRPGP